MTGALSRPRWPWIPIVLGTYAALLLRFRQSAAALLVWPAALAALIATSLGGGLAGLSGRSLVWRGRAIGGSAPS